MDFDIAGAVEGLECADDAEQFHAIVGGAVVTAGELEGVQLSRGRGVAQYGAVSAGTGVAARRAVGVDDDLHRVPFESDLTIIRSGSDRDAWLWGLGKGYCVHVASRPASARVASGRMTRSMVAKSEPRLVATAIA